jgi:hypothetical protein
MKKVYKTLLVIYTITGIYTILRYHYFGDVLWKDFPVYTLNKIIIFSAIVLLAVRFFLFKKTNTQPVLSKIIFGSVILHAVLSLMILKPYYLKAFFASDQTFSFAGNLSLLFGSIAFLVFMFSKQLNISQSVKQKLVFSLTALHLLMTGGTNWLTPENWQGHFPPITLISFALVLIVLYKNLKT